VAAAARLLRGEGAVNLAASVPPDASHLPELTLDVAALAAAAPAHGYAPAGLPALREAAAARLGRLGLPTTAGQVHVANGAQHALHLALGALCRAGDVVAVEDPTYVGILDLLDARGLRALPVPAGLAREDPATFTRLCRGAGARAVVVVPVVHSPTGRVARPAELDALAGALDTCGLPVIEDNTVADLVFSGERPASLAARCQRAPVVSVESTSKVGWGGLRVGWLRADVATVERTVAERHAVDLGTSVAAQLLACQLLDAYDDLVGRRRATLAARAAQLVGLLRDHLPDWEVEAPGGGLSLWADVGEGAERFDAHALRRGVVVAPGTSASRTAVGRSHLRLCFDRPPLELEAAVPRLRRAWEDARGWR
jgi:DNA-binding transcriptional MocR family regulator